MLFFCLIQATVIPKQDTYAHSTETSSGDGTDPSFYSIYIIYFIVFGVIILIGIIIILIVICRRKKMKNQISSSSSSQKTRSVHKHILESYGYNNDSGVPSIHSSQQLANDSIQAESNPVL